MARRISRGRQKIEMVKVKDEGNLQVTFSKRRTGIFKKANELSVLCGAEIALIVFSPGQRVYSFGHPSVESIIERYLKDQNNPSASDSSSSSRAVLTTMNATERMIQAHRNARLHQMNQEIAHLEKQLEEKKKRSDALERSNQEDPEKEWWKKPTDELDLKQLTMYAMALEGLMKKVKKEISLVSIKHVGAPLIDLTGGNNINGRTSINAAENVSPFGLRVISGQVTDRRAFVTSCDNQEEIDLNRCSTPPPSESGSSEKADDDHKKPIRVHQFI